MCQDDACVICQRLVREVNNHDRSLSLPLCLPPSFPLATPHYTGVYRRCKGYDVSSAFCRCLAEALTPVNASSVSASAACALNHAPTPPGDWIVRMTRLCSLFSLQIWHLRHYLFNLPHKHTLSLNGLKWTVRFLRHEHNFCQLDQNAWKHWV